MNNLLVTTMPIKPQAKTNIGMCFSPLISEVVAKSLNVKNVLSTNTLHSYINNKELISIYTQTLNEFGITYDNLFIDEENIEVLLDCVNQLIKQKNIVERENVVLNCPCGKVDIIKEGIRNFNGGDLYIRKDNNIYCRLCGMECKPTLRKDLYFYLDPNVNCKVNIIPSFLESDFFHFYKNMPGNYLLISKSRDTGYKIKALSGNEYNLDIDFLWMNYVQCFNEDNQIIIASNHQLFEMFILNYINNSFGKKKLSFIATPYINKTNLDIYSELARFDDVLYKKIVLLYTLKWKKKNCDWDETIFKGIAKLGRKNRIALYNIITNEFDKCTNNLNEYVNNLLVSHISMQKNIKALKKK